MHHGTWVTHVPWCMSGSLTCGGGDNVPGIPGACTSAILRIWQEAHDNKEPRHQQSWHWPNYPGIFRPQYQKVNNFTDLFNDICTQIKCFSSLCHVYMHVFVGFIQSLYATCNDWILERLPLPKHTITYSVKKVWTLRLCTMRVVKHYVKNKALFETWKQG